MSADRGKAPKTLADQGITKDQSADWQKMGEIPDDEFEAEVGFAGLRATQRVRRNVDRVLASGIGVVPQGHRDANPATPCQDRIWEDSDHD